MEAMLKDLFIRIVSSVIALIVVYLLIRWIEKLEHERECSCQKKTVKPGGGNVQESQENPFDSGAPLIFFSGQSSSSF